jgi:predicted transcriptional regulator
MIAETLPLGSLSAGRLMSKDLLIIPRDMSLKTAARMLIEKGVSGAPVVDDSRRCIGVISTTDFMRAIEANHRPFANTEGFCFPWQMEEHVDKLPTAEVGEYMTTDPVLIPDDTRIAEMARQMVDAHIHRLIVVDDNRHPIGIVTSMDLLAAIARTFPE